ncbi:MAG: hypothetical protein ABIU05_24310 [Nitrospirales bacterium]
MPISIQPDRRFPICCPSTYHVGLREGHGLVWNLSVSGWRFSGDVLLRVGETCPLTVNGPDQHPFFVAGVTVRGAEARSMAWKSWRLRSRHRVG